MASDHKLRAFVTIKLVLPRMYKPRLLVIAALIRIADWISGEQIEVLMDLKLENSRTGPPPGIPDKDLKALAYEATRFFVWGAGQGLSPLHEDDVMEPETYLLELSDKHDMEDWDAFPELVKEMMEREPQRL